jgi:triacylglycerol esterase/lipase EstA (alpha/beta hydrolase family)
MSRYIIILSTIIESVNDTDLVSLAIAGLKDISDWSIDLEDCDKVIRIVSTRDISHEFCEKLALFGIKASVMQVFDDRYHLL